MNWYLNVFKKYAEFSGRARRKEYWNFVWVNFVIALVLLVVDVLIKNDILSLIYGLAVLIPAIAVGIRRLHDTGRSGWWTFIGFVPLIGSILLIVWMASDSTPGANSYGPNPKEVTGQGYPA